MFSSSFLYRPDALEIAWGKLMIQGVDTGKRL